MNFSVRKDNVELDVGAGLVVPPFEQPRSLITIDEILHRRPQQPVATSRDRGWGGVTVDLHRPYFDVAESYPGLDHHLICFCPSGSSKLTQIRNGSVHRATISMGMSYLMPAGYESSWEGDSGLSARIRVPVALIARAADECDWQRHSAVELRNIFETRDATIGHLTLMLLSELQQSQHPAQRLMADALSAALAVHLLKKYNAFEAVERETEICLGKQEIARLTDYIESNLDRSIGLAELAGVVNVSRFHFIRLFKRSTGTTPIDFVEQSRISRAQSLIVETDIPLAEIALITGFADQSHFTRRFRNRVGCTPAAYSRNHGRRRTTRKSGY
ncbi:AraC family transcriptional regulator [Rhizobium sp. S152]|uniref:AraC family transcriptional regulator n=1 Tax=Rhizobium sp. S152 TaxID=3055038 RepID=UPI0025A93B1F|nr:AraC family transcriptional regulator [Rhizobium sp. S152]MDM9627806.1 AraC family transcriptional regulator [Rhizobium sp. S152]